VGVNCGGGGGNRLVNVTWLLRKKKKVQNRKVDQRNLRHSGFKGRLLILEGQGRGVDGRKVF